MPRHLQPLRGSIDEVEWPAEAVLTAEYRPADLFGVRDEEQRLRTSVLVGGTVTLGWDANYGRGLLESHDFLPRLGMSLPTRNGTVAFDGTMAIWSLTCRSLEDLLTVVWTADYWFPVTLSVQLGSFVGLNSLRGPVGPNFEFNYEVTQHLASFHATSDDLRSTEIKRALDYCALTDVPGRLILAAEYYRQALRLSSGNESFLPDAVLGETCLNLAKCLTVLFTDSREEIREGCVTLGFTRERIESQIIPIVLLRSHLDVAHPVVPTADDLAGIPQLRAYVKQALSNVRVLLDRALEMHEAGTLRLLDHVASTDAARGRLLEDIAKYVSEPTLDTEFPAARTRERRTST